MQYELSTETVERTTQTEKATTMRLLTPKQVMTITDALHRLTAMWGELGGLINTCQQWVLVDRSVANPEVKVGNMRYRYMVVHVSQAVAYGCRSRVMGNQLLAHVGRVVGGPVVMGAYDARQALPVTADVVRWAD